MARKKFPARGPYVSQVRLNRDRVPSFDEYPFSLPVVREFSKFALHPSVTIIVGPNGSGKSTLLEAIAIAWGFNAEGGSKNFNFATHPSHSALEDYLTIVKTSAFPEDGFFLRAESFYNVASAIENLGPDLFASYGGKSPHGQSHGESFLALFLYRFFGGFYILDEPEAALSPDGLLTFIARLHQLVESGSQFLIATHSPILLTYPLAQVFEIQEGVLVNTPFDQTRHFQLSRDLLNRPEIVAREICGIKKKPPTGPDRSYLPTDSAPNTKF